MRITAPVSSPDEVEALVGAGAGELYCGVVPREWLHRYSRIGALNRRINPRANMGGEEELAEVVRRAHGLGARVLLALNAPSYAPEQEEQVLRLARRSRELGVDALIVADPGAVALLGAEPDVPPVHVSSVAGTLNAEAVALWQELGATRVILPRSVTVAEVERIARKVPGIPLEVFLLNDGCALEEADCFTIHHHAVGAYCCDLARQPCRFERPDGGEVPPEAAAALEAHREDHRRFTRLVSSTGGATDARGRPAGPCGLCALPALARVAAWGKVAGREASMDRKVASVRLCRQVLDRVRDGAAPDTVRELARSLRGTPDLCDAGYLCYYR